jgi:acetyl esterase/lipase
MAARWKLKEPEMTPFVASPPDRHDRRPQRLLWANSGHWLLAVWLTALAGGILAAPRSTALAEETTVASSVKVKITPDQVYGSTDGVELRCDVYAPVSDEAGLKRPTVLLIHGGAWSAGSRRTMGGYAMRLARAGMVAITIDYRLAPAWKFPAQVDDVRLAMLWAADQSEVYGIDPERMGLFGYSAGGHLACMIGTLVDEPLRIQASTTCWPADDPRLASLPQPLAICAGGPPCDLTVLHPDSEGLAYFLGGSPAELPDVYAAASPVSHASSGDIPTLFIHGERDAIVPLHSSRSLYDAQLQAGVASEFLVIEKQGHLVTFINSQTGEAMVKFFQKWLSSNQDGSP